LTKEFENQEKEWDRNLTDSDVIKKIALFGFSSFYEVFIFENPLFRKIK